MITMGVFMPLVTEGKETRLAGKTFIADIRDRDRVYGTFLVQQKQVPLNKNAKPYIAMVIMDRTGSMEARVWDNVEQTSPLFESGDFVEILGLAVAYQGKIQLKVDRLKKISTESVDPEEYLPASPRDRGEMLSLLRVLIEKISDRSLREMIIGCLDDVSFRERFARAPAAKTIHHAYLGGLLEHTLSIAELADHVADLYPELDRDLLIAGAFFHDIGKIRELEHNRSFEYTDEGRLLGHIVIGAMIFIDWAEAHPNLSDQTILKITHMILSHHGSYEFGSPKRPKFTEALVLNYLDELDSKIHSFKEIAAREQGQRWSSYQKLYDRYLFLGGDSPSVEQSNQDSYTPNSSKTKRGSLLFHQLPITAEKSAEHAPDVTNEKHGEPLELFTPEKQRK